MKKSVFLFSFYCLAFLVIIANAVYLILDNVYIDISDVPKGEYQTSFTSTDGEAVLKIYKVETSIGNAVRVTKTENNVTKNIFWQANASNANVYWAGKDIVIINGIVLELSKDETYDSRSMRSIFNDGLMGWDK